MIIFAFAILAASVAYADSIQMQTHSKGVMTQSSSSDSSIGSIEADYVKWPNGGGKVHKLAHVDRSAEIDAESKVGSYVEIAAGVALRKSMLSGLSADKPGRVAKGAVIEGSTLQGSFDLHNNVNIQNTMLQGPFEIAQKVRLSQCQLSALYGSKPIVIKSDMSNQMMLYPAQ